MVLVNFVIEKKNLSQLKLTFVCSNVFGWEGDKCDQPTSTTFYILFSEAFFLFWLFFLIFTTGKTLFLYSKARLGKESLMNINPVFFVTY